MEMAGRHLSRNKMLFFSGALFVTLVVGVHLTLYFPSVAQFLSSPPPYKSGDSCLSLLHDIVWVEEGGRNPNLSRLSWDWAAPTPVIACGFQKLGRSDVSDLLKGSWIVIAGDSQARLFVLSLLNLVLDPMGMEAVQGDLFRRHSDYHIMVEEQGVKLDFFWAPYESNLIGVLGEFRCARRYPDILVMGSGLWHMLHFNNASDYGVSLEAVKRSVVSLLPIMPEFGMDGTVTGSVSIQSPHMFWLGMPTLVNSLLNTEEKKEKMIPATWEAYERELNVSKLLRRSDGPLVLLDVGSLSRNCGLWCTTDGMHYDVVVYEAALHVMLHMLLIESQQRN